MEDTAVPHWECVERALEQGAVAPATLHSGEGSEKSTNPPQKSTEWVELPCTAPRQRKKWCQKGLQKPLLKNLVTSKNANLLLNPFENPSPAHPRTHSPTSTPTQPPPPPVTFCVPWGPVINDQGSGGKFSDSYVFTNVVDIRDVNSEAATSKPCLTISDVCWQHCACTTHIRNATRSCFSCCFETSAIRKSYYNH